MKRHSLIIALAFVASGSAAFAQPAGLDQAIAGIAHRWAKANYDTADAAKGAAFEAVASSAQDLARSNPGRAEPLVWEAIALSGAAKAEGGFSALRKAREARDLLLNAESIDPNVINGAVYTTLGSLYANVPGWPIGFGDHKKARKYLEKALALAPNDIDANYFFADFLAGEGEYAQSAQYAQRALDAPPRAGREDADAGRRHDAEALLSMLHTKHADQLANK